MAISIQVTPYWGDLDPELIVIGPYPTEAARDADLRRLTAICQPEGDADFVASDIDPASLTDRHWQHGVSPDKVASVRTTDDLVKAIYDLSHLS